MRDSSSKIFRFFLWNLKLFRRPYLWAKKKWPESFEKRLDPDRNLDTSRMLAKFNSFHRLFFSRGFDTISFDEAELQNIAQAGQRGPLVFLMRNWGQVEYNYFNHLLLSRSLPLVSHNNMVKMGHWMPWHQIQTITFQKLDRFFSTGEWPYNRSLFDPAQALREKRPILFCLNLPKGTRWIESEHEAQREMFHQLIEIQGHFDKPLQLIPLHFIYDKHPGRAKKSLPDILFGAKENPGYLRKMILFLRNYQKRAVAKVGEPLSLRDLSGRYGSENNEAVAEGVSIEVQRVFEMESRQVTGPKLQSRRRFLDRIMEDSRFRDRLQHAATQDHLSFEKAERKTLGYLKEIASDINFTVIELWDFFLSWLFNSLYDGLEVDQAGLAKVKKVAKDSPLVLVPCHKSHVDYLLLSYIFYRNDLSLPHVCAGINLNFWPLGGVFRRSGGYFIRRSLPGDSLYPLALKSYVKELMREGYFQEFFIEGTRSRSGKLFPPKTGLLQMMVESFLEGGVSDVYFVPVALGYERVLEQASYLKEKKGAKKSNEKFTDLFHLPKFLRRRYGKVYLQFAEPISLAAQLGHPAEGATIEPNAVKNTVQDLAEKICVEINEVSTLMPSAPVATALLLPHGKSTTAAAVLERARSLLDFAEKRGVRLSERLRHSGNAAMEEVLSQFAAEGLVREHQDTQGSFLTVREETRDHLDFFKNQGIHAYAGPALQQICQMKAPGRYEELRRLLGKEFFLPPNPTPLLPAPPEWLGQVLLPVLESYWLAFDILEQIPVEKMEERKLVQQILETGETYRMRGTIEYQESLSRFSVQHVLARCLDMGILRNHQAEMGVSGRKIYSRGPDTEALPATLELLGQLLNKAPRPPKTEEDAADLSNVLPLLPKSEGGKTGA